MLDAASIQQLKRINICSNVDKTMERVREILINTSSEDKKTIEELAGIVRVSLNRIYKTGCISAKIAVAMAQVINVDPFYLIGEADEKGECNDKILKEFLIRFGYEDLVVNLKSSSKRSRKKVEAESIPAQKNAEDMQEEEIKDDIINDLTNEQNIEPSELAAKTENEQSEVEQTTIELTEVEQDEVKQNEVEENKVEQDIVEQDIVEKDEIKQDKIKQTAIGQAPLINIAEDEMILLIRAVMLRAKLGSDNAIQTLHEIKNLLLS